MYNTNEIRKNAFRITKVRGITALRIRVPGGHLEAKHLSLIQEIADTYGNGTVHLTTRQGFELPGIKMEKIPEINEKIFPLLQMLGIPLNDPQNGYPAAGTRNVSACIGNRVCPYANYDTTSLALKIERAIYPNDLHFKVAVTGCPNDCIKAHMQDFGVICTTQPNYDENRCINCNACIEVCKQKAKGVLFTDNALIKGHDESLCIGCGECIIKCPTAARTRERKRFFKMVIMGRTGKKEPRLARTFLTNAAEEVIIKVIKNTYAYVEKYIDKSLSKEHIGYILDRTGYEVFKESALRGIELDTETRVAEKLF